MLTKSSMKSLLSPFFSSPVSKQAPPSLLFSFPPKFNLLSNSNPTAFKISTSLSIKPTVVSSESPSIFSIWRRCLQSKAVSSSGELCRIGGPILAGKTTTILRRVQSESDHGSFQVKAMLQLDKRLKGLCYSGRLSEAVGLLCRTGLKVDHETYALLLQECLFEKQYKKGLRIHAQMIVTGYTANEYLETKLLILHAKSGDLKAMHALFDKLMESSLIAWNAMIAGYVQKGLGNMGIILYVNMIQKGFKPDQYTFASVFKACAALATLMHGKQVHASMIKCQIRENVVVNSALMDMYFKCSNLQDAHKVFDESLNKNVVTWTSLILGYGQHGKVGEVLELFHRMKKEGFKPNYVTFLAVLSACSHGGLVDEGWKCFSSMKKDYGIQPRRKHYASMVDLLGRAGRLQEAYEFVLNSPCKEHSVMWGALLGACKIHGDTNLIKLAANKFFELEPANAGKYVVLCNAYATSGFWDGVAQVRGMMRESGIMKEPAYSRIDVQGEVHMFLMGDSSHRKFEELRETIIKIMCTIKDSGYTPNISEH